MTREELLDLVLKARKGDKRAATELIRFMEPTVQRFAKFLNTRLGWSSNTFRDDIVAAGQAAVFTSIEGFDTSRTTSWRSYASSCALSQMKREATRLLHPLHGSAPRWDGSKKNTPAIYGIREWDSDCDSGKEGGWKKRGTVTEEALLQMGRSEAPDQLQVLENAEQIALVRAYLASSEFTDSERAVIEGMYLSGKGIGVKRLRAQLKTTADRVRALHESAMRKLRRKLVSDD